MNQPQQAGDADSPIAGRFQVEEVLGRGGMGAVYRVRDTRTGKLLALKRGEARDPKKDEKRKGLLEREYHTLSQLAHPCIIEVYDYGVDDEGPFYTMELLDGEDLDKQARLPWPRACALLRDVASSLAILHSRGLLHRDVSARNVRCTADGRAKLLDFGAMACMGVAKAVVGTPPFVAPETLQMQALDGRADLFSLGALGYFLLTGRHAFPARRLADLRDLWRSAPTQPVRFVPELPRALNQLIVQLLSLDRGARPQSAAEVMERLCTIAGLPSAERPEVSRAYLSTPTLIAREPALLEIRKRMLSLMRGDGGALLIEGPAGSGRSRMLDACVLEGKLLGAAVLRADASDGALGDWGVVRALGNQLFELMPQPALEAVRLSRNTLGHVFEALCADGAAANAAPERPLLLRELRDFFLTLSRYQRLMLVVDDVDDIDEPSAAWLAALAHKAEAHGVLVAFTVDNERSAVEAPPIQLLRSYALSVPLGALDAEQTVALMRSVFGDVANLQLVAGRIHALSLGNPRATIDLAQHLVDRGLARYQSGRWSLPSELDHAELPRTLSAALAARIAPLSSDARELALITCLGEGDPLRSADYPELTAHGDSARVFRAVDELVAARVFVTDAEHYRFSQRGFLNVIADAAAEPDKRAIHARLSELLQRSTGHDVMRRAHHLLDGGRERQGVELLCGRDLQLRLPPLPLAERALAVSEQLKLPARAQHELRNAILTKAPTVPAIASFKRQLPRVLAQLESDSGLACYRGLTGLEPSERLRQALDQAQARYAAAPDHERVYAPADAIRELARFTINAGTVAMQLYDLDFLESLPSLEPLLPLSPALTVVWHATEACKDALRGRTLAAVRALERVLERLAQRDHAGFDDASYRSIFLGIHYMLGMIAAAMGMAVAEQHAQLLEADREHRVNAWRVRVSLHLNQGNAEEAHKCQRRAELLLLQDGSEQRALGGSPSLELMANAIAGDLLGVRRSLDLVEKLAEHYPGWQPVYLLGQCHYRWLQGDLTGALDMLQPAFALARPVRHPYFAYLAAAKVGLLCELDRIPEAVQLGREYLELCRRERLASTDRWLAEPVSLALARAGEHAEAIAVIEQGIATAEAQHMVGLTLGTLYEARARVAIWSDDHVAFKRYSERCADEYKKGRNPALSAKFARLMEEARLRRDGPEETLPPGQEFDVSSQTETGFETVESRLLECMDGAERARCALSIALESMEGSAGYLFGIGEGQKLSPLASLPESTPDAQLSRWLEAALELETSSGATATADGEDDSRPVAAERFTDAEGRTFMPIFLTTKNDNEERIAAVLALHVTAAPRSIPPKQVLTEIAVQLVEHGDVTGVVI